MPSNSTRQIGAPEIAIVGGGVASLIAGIKLREMLPEAMITLYTAAGEAMVGGQLASWDEGGYPVEHGLHALFGFYDHVLPLLKKIGAYQNLARSQEHIFIRERDAIHRFDLRTWPATYRGLTSIQKMQCLAAAPALGKLLRTFKRNAGAGFSAWDGFDLRALARAHGVPESVLQSNFVRQFYEAAFNAPSELSAAVALQSIFRIFSKRWHYYFKLPTRDSIIEPLQRHFTEACRGRMAFNQKLIEVRSDDAGLRVAGLHFEDQTTGCRYPVKADQYLLALGLEDFKRVNFGEVGARHDYFRNVHKLEAVSSFSIQAWFKDDPVPPGIDSLITGMPPPFGILCPITRVRASPVPAELPLRHEVIATGPERGYEDTSDEALETGFLDGLRAAGFRIPDDPRHRHIVLRRNREPSHRYLLTRPGQLRWRPAHESPLANLCLAGAWVRNDFALPCVEAAAQGAIRTAGIIAARSKARPRDAEEPRVHGLPPCAPLIVPPPYIFPRSAGSLFMLDAIEGRLAESIPDDLTLFPGLADRVLFAVLRHEDVHARCDPSGARHAYNEVFLGAFVRRRGIFALVRPAIHPIGVYVDDETALVAGRDVYGFPKRLARIDLGTGTLRLERRDGAAAAAPAPATATKLMSAGWSADRWRGTFDGGAKRAAKSIVAARAMASLSRLMPFFNVLHMPAVGERHDGRAAARHLTAVSLTGVVVRQVSTLRDLRLRVDASIDDPFCRLPRSNDGADEIRAHRGLAVEFAFSMGPARVIGTPQTLAGLGARPPGMLPQ